MPVKNPANSGQFNSFLLGNLGALKSLVNPASCRVVMNIYPIYQRAPREVKCNYNPLYHPTRFGGAIII